MSVQSEGSAVQRIQTELARLQKEKAREMERVAQDTQKAQAAMDSANRSSFESSIRSHLRSAERYSKSAGKHQKKVADIEGKISRKTDDLGRAQKRLASARRREDQRADRERAKQEADHQRRLSAMTTQLDSHEEKHRRTESILDALRNPPPTITVLFLASSPRNQTPLKLDEEARAIEREIRGSEHRDSISFATRWAVRPLDVLQAINETRPSVLHFSGHGSDDTDIFLQDDAGRAKPVSNAALRQMFAATSSTIKMVFFNMCYSRAQANAVIEHVPAAIGMAKEIGDEPARVFSAQFYSAIGFGLPLSQAYEQARAAMMLEGTGGEYTPELFVAEGIDPADIVLVGPPE